MKKLHDRHIPSLIFWLVVILVALLTMPDVSGIVRDKGALSLPKTEESQVAATIEKKANHNQKVRSFALVFSNGDDKLSTTQKRAINQTLAKLKDSKAVKIINVTKSSDNAETKKQLDAKDGTTQMALVDVKAKGQVGPQTRDLERQIKTSHVKTYVTGSDVLNDDFASVTEKGIQKTEIIAAIFIFIVLIIVFRSPIVPLVSLLTVAISFLTSLNIIMTLADKVNFPISNFTQVFLVVVLFGIGTDYNILLYDDFKAALSQGIPKTKAARIARRFGGANDSIFRAVGSDRVLRARPRQLQVLSVRSWGCDRRAHSFDRFANLKHVLHGNHGRKTILAQQEPQRPQHKQTLAWPFQACHRAAAHHTGRHRHCRHSVSVERQPDAEL